ncbi:MAG: hypothetical protein JRI99_11100 [Deltaproteobacteria bacterium]|nr:hypothetical protein [Deltaproteobacteria bacterium]
MKLILKEKLDEFKRLTGEPLVFALVVICFLILAVFVIYPLFCVFRQSVLDDSDSFVGIGNYIHFFTNPYFRQVLYNTLFISTFATLGDDHPALCQCVCLYPAAGTNGRH